MLNTKIRTVYSMTLTNVNELLPLNTMKEIIKSKYLIPINQAPIENAALVLDENQILDMGFFSKLKKKFPSLAIKDFSDYIIMPGFINCHSHLELSCLRNKVKPKHSFTDWLQEIVGLKSQLTQEEICLGIQAGIDELVKWGVVAVGDISSDYLSYQELVKTKLIGRVYGEFIAVNPADIESRLNKLAEAMTQTSGSQKRIKPGISPHSTYTLCPQAFHTITDYIKKNAYHSAIHVGESREEQLFFNKRQGKLFEFINNIYPVSDEIQSKNPLSYLYSSDYLPKNSMVIHLNILTNDEISILKAMNLSVIHCPLSHDFFQHPPFQMNALLENGINLALGTDSLASNSQLNFFAEMRQLEKTFSFLSPEEIIKMATINGAKALQLQKGLGEIQKNCPHFLIGVRFSDKTSDPFKAVLDNKLPVIHL